MAFATSASAFGMKSSSGAPAFGSNSGSAPFGAPAIQPTISTSSPFGASATQPAGPNPGIFGASTPSGSNPSPFGAAASQTANPNPNPFGHLGAPAGQSAGSNAGPFTAAQPATSNPSPFGAFNAPQPSAPPSLFGGLGQNQNQGQGQNQTQSQNQSAPGGLFGHPQPAQQQPSSNIFGGSTWGPGTSGLANTSTQPTQGGFGSWGQNSQAQAQQQPQQQSTLFGSGAFGSQPQPQPQSGGLWGSSAAQSTGPSLFGQSASVPAQPPQPTPPFTRTTKFNDLPEQIQKIFETIDTHIQGRIQISNDLKARSLSEEPTKGAELIRKVHIDLVNTLSNLQADKAVVEELKSKVDLSVQDTIITTRIIDGFRNPQQNGLYLKNHASFPLEYFARAAEEIRQKLQWFKSTIDQIERRLASAQTHLYYNPQSIASTLQAQNATFVSLAAQTAKLDAELQNIKAIYRELWRAHTGSVRDPFNEADRLPGDHGDLLGGTSLPNLRRP